MSVARLTLIFPCITRSSCFSPSLRFGWGGAGGGRCCFTRCVVMQANIQQAVIIRGDWASSFSSPSDNQNPSFSDLLAASDSVYYEEGGAE